MVAFPAFSAVALTEELGCRNVGIWVRVGGGIRIRHLVKRVASDALVLTAELHL